MIRNYVKLNIYVPEAQSLGQWVLGLFFDRVATVKTSN